MLPTIYGTLFIIIIVTEALRVGEDRDPLTPGAVVLDLLVFLPLIVYLFTR